MTIIEYVTKRRFLFLLAALSLLLTSYPVERGSGQARVIFQACFELVLLAGLFAMRHSRAWFWLGVVLVVPAVLIFWGSVAASSVADWNSPILDSAGGCLTASFLFLLVVFILRDLFASPQVTNDRLFGALSVYLLLGVAWGFIYTAIEVHAPGSFVIGEALEPISVEGQGPLHRSGQLFYFSFVTLTTLGYGDISPVGSFAQMFTMWEAILGQAYLTILVARLVGLHVSSSIDS